MRGSEPVDTPIVSPGSGPGFVSARPADAEPAVDSRIPPDPGDPIDLQRAVSIAIETNPSVRAMKLRYEAMLETPRQQEALPDPMLSYTYMFSDVVTANGPSTTIVEASQAFPYPGKRRLRADVSRAEAEAARQAWLTGRLAVGHRVHGAYYDIFRVDRSIEIVREEAKVLERLERVARSRYATGLVSQGEVLQAQTERSRIEERLLKLREEREDAAAQFNSALGRPQSEPVGRAVEMHDVPDGLPSEEELYRIARERRPEVAEARKMADAGRSMESLARRDYYPDFRVGLRWNQIGPAETAVAPDSGKDAWMVTLGVSIPLWRGKLDAARKEALSMTASAESEVVARGILVETDVRSALAAVRARRDLLQLYESTLIPQADSSLQAAEAAYQSGRTTFLSVLDSERSLLDLKLARAVTLGELGRAVAMLEEAVGLEVGEAGALQSGAEPNESTERSLP